MTLLLNSQPKFEKHLDSTLCDGESAPIFLSSRFFFFVGLRHEMCSSLFSILYSKQNEFDIFKLSALFASVGQNPQNQRGQEKDQARKLCYVNRSR